MPRACCVPGCKANYKTFEVSAFRFPSDERRRLQWVKAIHREDFTPSSTSVVCARHFEEHFIITEDSITRPDGTVITAKRGTPALAKDAFPTIFPNQPKYLSKEAPPARTNPQERKDKMLARDEVQFQVWMENDMINSFEEFGDKFVGKLSKDWLFVSSDCCVCLLKPNCDGQPNITASFKVMKFLSGMKTLH
ncbi:hypothetical protein Pcinc_010099 [Petrolisthes cinctipes]|uniref:THAP-type domain-containing protein n=1 Tax=Petrolisthes cinctipes TaxID=88211 RepID=A0AAE1KVP5_PETCI|nr:hypothetical protein Pcinc_010099 [Petrolisthes cinctipes]